jgi:hypothetical protein
MGTVIEFNDTLKLSSENGMPDAPQLGEEYQFKMPEIRIFHLAPVRVFLVHEIGGRWKYIGHAVVVTQTIHAEKHTTSGVFRVTKLYDDEYARKASQQEAPGGKSYY